MPKNLRTEAPIGRHRRRTRPSDVTEIRGSNFSDLKIPKGKESASDLGPALAEIDSLKVADARRFAHARLPELIRQQEDLADRFRMAGRLTSQLKCLGVLCGYAIKTGDRGRRLGAYYQSLDAMRLRVKKWGEHPENAERRNAWRELEMRVLALMLDMSERIDIKRKTLNKKRGGARTNDGRVVDAETAVLISIPEMPIAEEVPEPEAPNYEEMDDEALTDLIPEDDR